MKMVRYFDRLGHFENTSPHNCTFAICHSYETRWEGSCIDHIYVKESTIPQAGKGGFARRPLRKDDVIIPVQMLHVRGGRDVLRRRVDIALEDSAPNILADKQYIYNYMYSHPESSVLLFPVNTGVVINHSSARMKNGKAPNAKLKWSLTDKKTQYFLNKPLEALMKEDYASIVVDFVATRDIAADEEITLDYGKEWENAWNRHVEHWEPPFPTGGIGLEGEELTILSISSKKIYEMNQNKFDEDTWTWSEDHFTVCDEIKDPLWRPLDTVAMTEYNVGTNHSGFEIAKMSETRKPCMILDGDEEEGNFDVFYFRSYETEVEENGSYYAYEFDVVENLPAESLMFVSRPLRSDQHRNDGNRFVHEIKITDSIFPEVWKDLKITDQQQEIGKS
mmetsp:Transcript_41837/g.98020  ORF Transcript_41837/g.98020 Transcript_41837/m.98020 type:complete len:392 (+) Transcript_41837:2193-3368(+)